MFEESRKEYRRALADYAEATRVDPALSIAHNNRAWLLAACPDAGVRDGKAAVEAATRACELTKWQAAPYLDTLAAACAEASDFDAAVKWQTRANAMFPDGPDKSQGQARLKLYKDRTPYHLPGP